MHGRESVGVSFPAFPSPRFRTCTLLNDPQAETPGPFDCERERRVLAGAPSPLRSDMQSGCERREVGQ